MFLLIGWPIGVCGAILNTIVKPSMEIGEQIRVLRKAKGIKQADLAKLVGKSSDAISQIERGIHSPTQKTLDLICHHLGVEQKLVLR